MFTTLQMLKMHWDFSLLRLPTNSAQHLHCSLHFTLIHLHSTTLLLLYPSLLHPSSLPVHVPCCMLLHVVLTHAVLSRSPGETLLRFQYVSHQLYMFENDNKAHLT
ncbi:unnamed protein product [Tetraodon nigroviridis]|uniref:(spotted green pufferfish) hypothetical protein n=1 Tax=Tetraodon nigroviridis TaxID=99883 RepID=Q4T7S8_TETNG|nr:unnamed protein product [Tetraodon nigroviridis]